MRKATIGITILLLTASLSLPALAQRPNRPGRGGETLNQPRPADRGSVGQRLQQQIAALKGDHERLVTALRAIHETAVQENAPKTAGKVEGLIRQREQTYQNTLRRLEQQQQRLQRAGTRGAREGQPRRGKRAPDFALQSFDGKTIRLSDYRGKIVVLEWFNFECPFSKYHYETVQTMANLAEKYKDQGVVWLAVNSTNHTTPAANRQFSSKQKLPFPILDDRSGEVGRKYEARTTPHMFVIDTDGTIVYDGAIDNAPLGRQQGGDAKVNYVDLALADLTSGREVGTPNNQPYGCSVKYARK